VTEKIRDEERSVDVHHQKKKEGRDERKMILGKKINVA